MFLGWLRLHLVLIVELTSAAVRTHADMKASYACLIGRYQEQERGARTLNRTFLFRILLEYDQVAEYGLVV